MNHLPSGNNFTFKKRFEHLIYIYLLNKPNAIKDKHIIGFGENCKWISIFSKCKQEHYF
jgi:hypothetical protein